MRYLPLLLLVGCGSLPGPLNAANVDPVLRVLGYCRDSGLSVADAERSYESGDKVGAALQAVALVQELREAGVNVPDEVLGDAVQAAAAVHGLVIGMRAIDGRDADGNKIR